MAVGRNGVRIQRKTATGSSIISISIFNSYLHPRPSLPLNDMQVPGQCCLGRHSSGSAHGCRLPAAAAACPALGQGLQAFPTRSLSTAHLLGQSWEPGHLLSQSCAAIDLCMHTRTHMHTSTRWVPECVKDQGGHKNGTPFPSSE